MVSVGLFFASRAACRTKSRTRASDTASRVCAEIDEDKGTVGAFMGNPSRTMARISLLMVCRTADDLLLTLDRQTATVPDERTMT
jgi:hypothetical protein